MIPFDVLTGAPGTGKSAVREQFRRRGYDGTDEPARRTLVKQRSFGGRGVTPRESD